MSFDNLLVDNSNNLFYSSNFVSPNWKFHLNAKKIHHFPWSGHYFCLSRLICVHNIDSQIFWWPFMQIWCLGHIIFKKDVNVFKVKDKLKPFVCLIPNIQQFVTRFCFMSLTIFSALFQQNFKVLPAIFIVIVRNVVHDWGYLVEKIHRISICFHFWKVHSFPEILIVY